MSESDKPEMPPAAPSAETITPVATEAAPSPEGVPTPENAAPVPTPKGPPGKGKDGKGGKKGGGSMGMPRRRTLDPISREDQQRFAGHGPKISDLDDEIASELEAAMSGFTGKDLIATEKPSEKTPAESGRKMATVVAIRNADVFVDIPGGRSQAVMSLDQFPEGTPKIGMQVEVHIEGYDRANGLVVCSRRGEAVIADWSTVAEGQVVEARVLETNKGGLAVDINGIRGFMPISQIDLYRVEQTEQFVNQKLRCLVTEVNPEERNLVVSRRALLEREREEQKEKTWAALAEGQVRDGIIRSVMPFGAFVDLGGVDGLLHVSEMSWQRVNDPTTLVQSGQSVKVVVLKIDQEKRKISLGLKQLQASPWDNIQEKFHAHMVVNATVTRTMDFGAFAELEPGVEGLIHVSELARQRVWRVTDIVKPGQEVSVKILSIDPEQRRISLSLKEAIAPPVEKKEDEEEEEEVEEVKPRPPRTTPLRGGVGQESFVNLPEADEGEQ